MLCACGCGAIVMADSRGRPRRFLFGHHKRGTKVSPEQRAKMVEGLRRTRGPHHHAWKGESASYSSLHQWVARTKGRRGSCETCGAEGKTHLANLSGEYRRDVEDYVELCPACHVSFDRGTARYGAGKRRKG